MATVTTSRLILGVRIQLVSRYSFLGREGGSSHNIAMIVVFVFCIRMHT